MEITKDWVSATLHIDNAKIDALRALARKNNIKPNKENIVDMALNIAISVSKYSDEKTFQILTELKK